MKQQAILGTGICTNYTEWCCASKGIFSNTTVTRPLTLTLYYDQIRRSAFNTPYLSFKHYII